MQLRPNPFDPLSMRLRRFNVSYPHGLLSGSSLVYLSVKEGAKNTLAGLHVAMLRVSGIGFRI